MLVSLITEHKGREVEVIPSAKIFTILAPWEKYVWRQKKILISYIEDPVSAWLLSNTIKEGGV